MNVIDSIVTQAASIAAVRRDIHAHPELCFEEVRTADLVAQKLTEWGIPIHRGMGKTGVVGIVKGRDGGASGRAIGLRADMDALPMQEFNTFAHASKHQGKMHACGHDGHVAMLLAAAQHFANARFRCIELRRPMVRCSNTGVTAVVNHLGGVEDLVSGERQVLEDAEGNHFTRGTLFATARVPVEGRVTVYARLGDWVGVLGFVLGVGLLGFAKFKLSVGGSRSATGEPP